MIDTASLMNKSYIDMFIKKISPVLHRYKRVIIVPKEVYLELLRHIGSSDERKSELALHAIELFRENRDLFDLEGFGSEKIAEEDIYKAFADAALLAKLTINLREGNQLLITQDRKLSKDAKELNFLESCKGHKIEVCYINDCGNLKTNYEHFLRKSKKILILRTRHTKNLL
jgi:hypothetical protein